MRRSSSPTANLCLSDIVKGSMTGWLRALRAAVRILRRAAFMNGISRRSVLKTGGACLGMTLVPSMVRGQASDHDGLQRWVEQNAVLIDPAPDRGGIARAAERVIEGVGDAKIVMLG